MKHMLDDHKKDVAEFEKESKSGGDPDVKSFAAKTLPTLKEHLQQAQAAEKANARRQIGDNPTTRGVGLQWSSGLREPLAPRLSHSG
jgi:hypothetical protein